MAENMISKEQSFVSAVVYLGGGYDTAAFLSLLAAQLAENFAQYEIICVDDACHPHSVEAVRQISLQGKVLSILHMGIRQGLEASMNAGVDLAIGDFVFEFDSTVRDYPPERIMEVYHRALEGYDIVALGSKNMRLTSKLFYKLYNRSANAHHKLSTEAFRILSRRAINRIHTMSVSIPYRKALYAASGLKQDTLFYTSQKPEFAKERDKGRGETAVSTLLLFTDVAYKFATMLTILMMIATVGVGIYVVVVYMTGAPVEGFTTIMLVMTGSFFAVFGIMTIILKYLSMLVSLVFSKQRYSIESIEKQ